MTNKDTDAIRDDIVKSIQTVSKGCAISHDGYIEEYYRGYIDGLDRATEIIDNAPTVEDRMVYVQETVNTILNSCTGNTDIDKAFRNAARLVQNAIDGKSVDFEEIERSEEE